MSALTRVLQHMKQVQKRCKKVDELLCAGYARISAENIDIPMDIIYFVVAFFVIFEQWDPEWKGKQVDIDNDNNIITSNKADYSTVLGQNEVNKGTHHWTVKVVKFVPNGLGGLAWWRLVIGIVNMNKMQKSRLESYLSYNKYEFVCNANCWNSSP